MVVSKEINELVNAYCRLRDRQYSIYHTCAKQNGLSTNELFVLDILWFAENGITQKEICERLSAGAKRSTCIKTSTHLTANNTNFIKKLLKKSIICYNVIVYKEIL